MTRPVKLPSLQNVTAGETATLNLPLGHTYEKLVKEFSGVTLAQMTSIALEANGKPIQYFASAADLDAINQYHGRPAANGNLAFYFQRPELDKIEEQRLFGLGTADLATLQLKFDIAGAASAPSIAAYASRGPNSKFDLCTKIKRFALGAATSGEFEIDSIPRGPRIAAIHFMKDDVSHVAFEVNGRKVVDASKTVLQEFQTEAGRVPSADFTTVDFIADGDYRRALVTAGVQDMRARLTLDTAGAVPFYVEYFDGWQGL